MASAMGGILFEEIFRRKDCEFVIVCIIYGTGFGITRPAFETGSPVSLGKKPVALVMGVITFLVFQLHV